MRKIVKGLMVSLLFIGYGSFGFLLFITCEWEQLIDYFIVIAYLFIGGVLLHKDMRRDIVKTIDQIIDEVIIRTIKDLISDAKRKEFWIVQSISIGRTISIVLGFFFWWRILPVILLSISNSMDYLMFLKIMVWILFLAIAIVDFLIKGFLKQNYRLMFKSTYRLICLFACVVQMAVLLPTVEKDARVVNQILDRNQHWYLFLLVVGLVILGTNKLVRRRLEYAMDLDHEREGFNWKFVVPTPLFINFDGLLILEAINVDYQGIHERFFPSITYEAKVRIRYTPIILYLQAPYDETYSFGKLSSKGSLVTKREDKNSKGEEYHEFNAETNQTRKT